MASVRPAHPAFASNPLGNLAKSFEVSAKKTVSFRPKDTVFWSERYSVLGVKHTVFWTKRYSVLEQKIQCFGRKDTVILTGT